MMTTLPCDQASALCEQIIPSHRPQLRPAYNEKVIAFVQTADTITVVFARTLGNESLHGARVVVVESWLDTWRVASNTFLSAPGQVTSRKGSFSAF